MTEPNQITLADDLHQKLIAFKPIFDTIIEEAFTFEEYAKKGRASASPPSALVTIRSQSSCFADEGLGLGP